MIAFISGGARSGKSSFAEKQVLAKSSAPIFAATGRRSDQEMAERIDRHQQDRPNSFITKEPGFHVKKVFQETDHHGVILVDCLTVWLGEALFQQQLGAEAVETEVRGWLDIIKTKNLDITFVSNDINEGGMPPGTEEYVRILENIHRTIIEQADTVVQVRSGIPFVWKGEL
jgi:adenosylcobinamide kinase / adenosylcobinamide-phosphate guanylyltransferase